MLRAFARRSYRRPPDNCRQVSAGERAPASGVGTGRIESDTVRSWRTLELRGGARRGDARARWRFGVVGVAGARRGHAASRGALPSTRRNSAARVNNAKALLRTVVETTPVAMVLFGEAGSIIFTNRSASELFFEGLAVEGQNFLSMIERAPASLRQALLSGGGRTLQRGRAPPDARPFTCRDVTSTAGQTLIAVRSVTQEINRHEVASLKKVIRIISHEINNSLGPIASLVSSARTILQRPEHLPKLPSMFDRIQERTLHLQGLPRRVRQAGQDPPAQACLGCLGPVLRRPAWLLAGPPDRGSARPPRLLRPRANPAGAHQPDQERI